MKVLIVGLGSIARKHISALKEIDPNVEIIALRSDKTANKAEDVRNIYQWEDIIIEQPNFAIISNPTSLHYDTLKKIMKLNIPLFIEKPLFGQVRSEEKELVAQFVKSDIPTYVACNLRFLDALQKLKELIKAERVNEVNVYCGSYLPDWRPNVNFRNVYSANKEMGGGVHIDLIHELDYVYWIFGEPIAAHTVFKNNSSLQISAYDYANYIWEYEGFCSSVVLNYYRRDSKRTIEVVCESGTYTVNLLQNKVSYNNEVIFESNQLITDTYMNQMKFFISEVLKNNNKFNSIEQAYIVLSLCIKE